MATRYKWYKYSITTGIIDSSLAGELRDGSTNAGNPAIPDSRKIGIILSKDYYTFKGSDGFTYYRFPNSFWVNYAEGTWSTSEYKYASSHQYYDADEQGWSTLFTYPSGAEYWKSHQGSSTFKVTLGAPVQTLLIHVGDAANKDDYLGYVTSTNKSAYPEDGKSGNYWYIYQSSDNFTINSITLTSYTTVGKTARAYIYSDVGGAPAPKYTYQYSINGGSYTTLTTTTNHYFDFIIPSNTNSLQLRANMTDETGVTTGYVYSSIYNFGPDSKIYVGTSNIARQASKIYVGVNGIARKVEKGYIGVNGVARRFL